MKKTSVLRILLYFAIGLVVGIAAKVPGFSGGALLFAFGLYGTVIETLNSPIKGFKKYWLVLISLGLGVGLGYVGFAGVINKLLLWKKEAVTAVFVGLILGTVPDVFKSAGERGRGKRSYIALALSFTALFTFFEVLKNIRGAEIESPGTLAFVLGGVLQGLSFIVPGLSSSSLLLFLGLEIPINEGISSFKLSVIIPFGIAMVICVLLLSKVMKLAFDKAYPILSHCVLGFVLATTFLIIPPFNTGIINTVTYILCIAVAAAVSYGFSYLCGKMKGFGSEKK